MFRLPSRHTFKALRSPLRYHRPLSSRHVHTVQIPYTGPPTYDTIARRFSSHPNLLAFFVRKKQQEARDGGEFIDIHDVGGVDPKDYDVLITDIDSEKLRSEIAEINVPVTLPPWDESDGYEDIPAPYSKPKSAVRPKKNLERAESQNESNKSTRRKRSKPNEMTADDYARKRRRTKGISARNILGEPVKSGGSARSFKTKNSLESGPIPEADSGQIRSFAEEERDNESVTIKEELIK